MDNFLILSQESIELNINNLEKPLIIENPNDFQISFKILSTARDFYKVKPKNGEIQPHESITITIICDASRGERGAEVKAKSIDQQGRIIDKLRIEADESKVFSTKKKDYQYSKIVSTIFEPQVENKNVILQKRTESLKRKTRPEKPKQTRSTRKRAEIVRAMEDGDEANERFQASVIASTITFFVGLIVYNFL